MDNENKELKETTEEISNLEVVEETPKEEKFTLKQAEEEIKAKQEKIIEDRKVRMTRFNDLINIAITETDCLLQVDKTSPLNDLRIIVVSRT